LALAAAIGLAIYRGSSRLNLNTFFTGTGLLLILIAAGLTAHAVHELQEARLLPVLIEHVWDTNALLHENSTAGSFLTGLFGYNGNPSLIEVTAYFSYLAVALAYFVRSPRPRPARGAPHPATLGQTD
ncbi:MAG: FTR1 family protein, partial [Gemmatimonadetes bacterium]|nr:FTR1 family protein [Gemmatimonadota bacterium]